MNGPAKVLIRAMVNAASSDGQMKQDRRDSILKEIDRVSHEEIDFFAQRVQ